MSLIALPLRHKGARHSRNSWTRGGSPTVVGNMGSGSKAEVPFMMSSVCALYFPLHGHVCTWNHDESCISYYSIYKKEIYIYIHFDIMYIVLQ